MTAGVRLIAMSLVTALAAPAHAGQATCSNPGVPVGISASSELLPGRLTLGLTSGLLSISSEETLDDIGGPVRYDSHLLLLETRLSVEYALSKYLAVGAALPYRVVDVDVAYFDPGTGDPRDPSFAGIHSRPETITGLGDGTLYVHGALALSTRDYLHARLGSTLPLGSTLDEDPFALGHIGQEHEHIQLGTGVPIPMIAAELQHVERRATLGAWAVAYPSLLENSSGYKPGSRISGGLTGGTRLGRALSVTLAAEVHAETGEKWNGVIPVDEGNAGRVDVYAGGTLAWRAMPSLVIVADVKVPVYSHVTGNQLDYGLVAGLGVSVSIDTRKRASYAGADVATLGAAGSASPLVAVPGKVTVFDLWADWCAPCRELDDRLAELARRYPDRIAIRKLEVIDSDSAAWKAYLAPGSFDLPHVKVYGADGVMRFEKSAPPAELAAAIEALVGAASDSSVLVK